MTMASLERKQSTRYMELRGVRVHNLKNLDLDIPLDQFVVVSGVSGSGKSSLAFDTLYAEGQRRYVESFSISARQHLERIDRPDADRIAHVPPAIAIRTDRIRRGHTDNRQTVVTTGDLLDGLRLLFARAGRIICPDCRQEVRSHSTADVVQVIGALPEGSRCQLGFDVAPQTTSEDMLAIWRARGFTRAIWDGATHDLGTTTAWPRGQQVQIIVDRVIAGKTTRERLSESLDVAFREGKGECWLMTEAVDSDVAADSLVIDSRRWKCIYFNRNLRCTSCRRQFLPVEPRLFSHLAAGACLSCQGTGIDPAAPAVVPCPSCHGTRFREEARAVQLAGHSISDLCARTIPEALVWVRSIPDTLSPAENSLILPIRLDVEHRLQTACDIGLGYLTLNRSTSTLSGGETRRLMLAAVIGSKTTGTLVVVDEPSAGLPLAEIPLVIEGLRRVQRLRNSVIAVDHSPSLIAAADHVIELGPGAGPVGGQIVFQGLPPATVPAEVQASHQTKVRRKKESTFRLTNICHPYAPKLDLEFLGNSINVISGPSGIGKTSLLTKVLYPVLCQRLNQVGDSTVMDAGTADLDGIDQLVEAALIDQSPLTKSSRSNPATWLGVFDEIRQTFAATVDARQKGFTAQSFSFNSASGGRCRSCLGTGLLKHDMQFLPDLSLSCSECGGTRYRREILDVKYRGRSIAEVLRMSVSDAAVFFRSQPRIQYRFQLLKQIGLDYLVLGQPSETLSGGEAQRLKLAARLAVPGRGPTLIVCDEPTTGLHPSDVVYLIDCFREMTANGHTLVLADNSPQLMAAADHVITLGETPPTPRRRRKKSSASDLNQPD